jgi:outer membrane protein OmpA-like peptidoglycan-associated protein
MDEVRRLVDDFFMRLLFLMALFLAPGTAVAQVAADEIRKSVYFDGGSYDIDDYQTSELSRWLDSIPNLLEKYEIQLISHTDPIGGKRYNEWLSKMRSQSVFQLLLSKDIPEHIIHAKDWGLENPVYSNDNFRGMILNRRVDVILHPVVF